MKNSLRAIIAISILTFITAGCSFGNEELQITVSGNKAAVPGGAALLKASSTEANMSYEWALTSGSFDKGSGNETIWTAPSSPGSYIVTVKGSNGRKNGNSTFSITVKEPPVKVTSYNLSNDGIGGKDANITFQNVSGKAVNALKVRVAMWNNFGERVTYLGSNPFQGITSDMSVPTGMSTTRTWSLYWATSVSKITPWVYEVAYSDGTVWKLEE